MLVLDSSRRRTYFIVLVLLVVAWLGSACGSDFEEIFAVAIKNDTPNVVRIKQCVADCEGGFGENETLRPGESHRTNTSSYVTNWWLAEDTSGNRLGCIALPTDRNKRKVPIAVSAFGTCPPPSDQFDWLGGRIFWGVLAALYAAVALLGGLWDFTHQKKPPGLPAATDSDL